MLGSAADAEDVLQETWLRWAEVDHGEVRDERAYLVRITTRLSLNRLRSLSRQRETYVGPWLPEPLLTTPDVAEDVELADSVSTAMLVVLETLTPTERAVFVLREVFDVGYDEIADAVDKSPAAVRQIAHRARNHVEARQPREQVSARQREAILDRFVLAVKSGDLQSLMDVLAPDVVLMTDGGGVKQAALRPILGRDKAVRFLEGAATKGGPIDAVHRTLINGRPGLAFVIDGEIDTLLTILVEDGVVAGLYAVRNPAKLTAAGATDHPDAVNRCSLVEASSASRARRGRAFLAREQVDTAPRRFAQPQDRQVRSKRRHHQVGHQRDTEAGRHHPGLADQVVGGERDPRLEPRPGRQPAHHDLRADVVLDPRLARRAPRRPRGPARPAGGPRRRARPTRRRRGAVRAAPGRAAGRAARR